MWGTGTGNSLEKQAFLLFKEISPKIKGDYFKILECSERVDLVYELIKKSKEFEDTSVDSQNPKSNKKSESLRKEGNDYYISSKKYLNALEKYTESIAFAEDKNYLALGYENRSAVLFEKKYYKECLKDIERALSLEYPENLKEKLLNRKIKAESLILESKPVKYYSEPPVVDSKNPLIPCASDSIKIQYNAKYGRHIIATKNIKIGEVISAEKSFCHVIHPESKFLHCHECLEICYNMIPCENCTNALYCSEKCKIQSYEKYHKYECKFPKILLSPGITFIKQAVIGMEDSKKIENEEPPEEIYRPDSFKEIYGFDFFKGIMKLLTVLLSLLFFFIKVAVLGKEVSKKIENDEQPEKMFRSDSFKEIMRLAINEEKRNFLNLCIPAITACVAYHALKKNEHLTQKYDSDEDDQNLKTFLYKAYMIDAFNPFNIKKIRYTHFDIKSKRVGTALYAFSSLYNHSCVPNSEFFHYGTQLVTRAKANIKKGEQVTICYGVSFSTTPKELRQAILKKNYLFDCDCRACRLNWATWDYLPLGRQLPIEFENKVVQINFSDSKSNEIFLEELLIEAKNIYCTMEKYEPCQTLLSLQDLTVEIYTYQASKDVEL